MSIPHKSLELLLEGWREHSRTGFHVSFLVGPDDTEFFRSLPAGQRLQAVLVCLTEDDKPAPLPTPADKAKLDKRREAAALADAGAQPAKEPATGVGAAKSHFPDGLTGLAVRWCQDLHFHSWLSREYPTIWSECGVDGDDELTAKKVVCELCQIPSRTVLNDDIDAASKFESYVRIPYSAQRKEDDVDANPF